jgi:type II secretory ATPase GspE/PulE/Tfp pilus assembly ATPase PilB-like protein
MKNDGGNGWNDFVKEVQRIDPDVIALQEVRESQH